METARLHRKPRTRTADVDGSMSLKKEASPFVCHDAWLKKPRLETLRLAQGPTTLVAIWLERNCLTRSEPGITGHHFSKAPKFPFSIYKTIPVSLSRMTQRTFRVSERMEFRSPPSTSLGTTSTAVNFTTPKMWFRLSEQWLPRGMGQH